MAVVWSAMTCVYGEFELFCLNIQWDAWVALFCMRSEYRLRQNDHSGKGGAWLFRFLSQSKSSAVLR